MTNYRQYRNLSTLYISCCKYLTCPVLSFSILSATATATAAIRYLRIKRLNQTYFVLCQEDDTIGYLKEQISIATKHTTKAEYMRIIQPIDNVPFEDDEEKISKYEEIKNESELYVVFQISDEEWEGVHIEKTEADNKYNLNDEEMYFFFANWDIDKNRTVTMTIDENSAYNRMSLLPILIVSLTTLMFMWNDDKFKVNLFQ